MLAVDCVHARLQFNSGDYYVACVDCGAMWMRKSRGLQPEYGFDHQGRRIGAAPEESNIGCQPAPGLREVVPTRPASTAATSIG